MEEEEEEEVVKTAARDQPRSHTASSGSGMEGFVGVVVLWLEGRWRERSYFSLWC